MAVVDRYILPEPSLSNLRDDMIQVIDDTEPMVNASREARSRQPEMASTVTSGGIPEGSDMLEYIQASLDALDNAKRATRCGVCQEEIDAAARDVARRLSSIQSTDEIYHTMKHLELEGELPRDSKWHSLKESERERIRMKVRGGGRG